MTKSSSVLAHATIFAANFFGGTSLVALGVFLFVGPWRIFELSRTTSGALAVDAALCFWFFVQHSGMVRKSYQDRLALRIPRHFHAAIYAIVSGVVLISLLVLWQPTEVVLVTIEGPLRWCMRGWFVAALFGFVWGIKSLGSFDGFGIRPIKAKLAGRQLREQPLRIRGPYRWVRHPLYTFVLVLLWSSPDITADRLLLNTTWTAWIVIGSFFEERDLVAAFGDEYRRYRQRVPMLVPFRPPYNR